MIWVSVFLIFAAVLLVMSCALALSKALAPKTRRVIGGILVVLFIAYVAIGLSYAVVTGQSHILPGGELDCPGPPYSTC